MSNYTSDLMLMLRLSAGQLSGEEVLQVRQRLQQDPQLRTIWNRIQATPTDGSSTGSDWLPRSSPTIGNQHEPIPADRNQLHAEESELNGRDADEGVAKNPERSREFDVAARDRFSPETTAAFVENRLAGDQARLFEQACLQSPDLFEEVVAAFRSTCRPPTTVELSTSQKLTERLMELVDWEVAANGVKANSPPIVATNQAGVFEIKAAASTMSRLARKRQSRPAVLLLWGMIAACLLALVAAASYLLINYDKPRIADPNQYESPLPDELAELNKKRLNDSHNKLEQKDDGKSLIAQENPDGQESPSKVNELEQLPDSPRFPKFDETLIATNPDLSSLPERELADVELMTLPVRTIETAEVRDQFEAIKPQWIRVDGVVAARHDDESLWHGVQYDQLRDDTRNWTSLPESWGTASLGELGELVMDEDTSIRLMKARSQNTIVVEIYRGRIALRDIPARTELQVRAVGHVWRVRNVQEQSTLGFDTFESQPRLHVRKGRLEADGLALKQDQQIVWDLQQKKNTIGNVLGSTVWIDKPVKVARMSEKTHRALLASEDLLANLHEIHGTNSASQRLLAVKWSFALAPETDVYVTWNSDDPQLRAMAFEWLIGADIRDQRVRQAWGGIARATGNPLVVREIVSWIGMARRGERVELDHATKMLVLLDHDEYIFRHASAYFLEAAFGNPVGYKPQDDQRIRQQTARAWAMNIRQVYNQRQPAPRQLNKNDQPKNRRGAD